MKRSTPDSPMENAPVMREPAINADWSNLIGVISRMVFQMQTPILKGSSHAYGRRVLLAALQFTKFSDSRSCMNQEGYSVHLSVAVLLLRILVDITDGHHPRFNHFRVLGRLASHLKLKTKGREQWDCGRSGEFKNDFSHCHCGYAGRGIRGRDASTVRTIVRLLQTP